jgi:hypothetical protein
MVSAAEYLLGGCWVLNGVGGWAGAGWVASCAADKQWQAWNIPPLLRHPSAVHEDMSYLWLWLAWFRHAVVVWWLWCCVVLSFGWLSSTPQPTAAIIDMVRTKLYKLSHAMLSAHPA